MAKDGNRSGAEPAIRAVVKSQKGDFADGWNIRDDVGYCNRASCWFRQFARAKQQRRKRGRQGSDRSTGERRCRNRAGKQGHRSQVEEHLPRLLTAGKTLRTAISRASVFGRCKSLDAASLKKNLARVLPRPYQLPLKP